MSEWVSSLMLSRSSDVALRLRSCTRQERLNNQPPQYAKRRPSRPPFLYSYRYAFQLLYIRLFYIKLLLYPADLYPAALYPAVLHSRSSVITISVFQSFRISVVSYFSSYYFSHFVIRLFCIPAISYSIQFCTLPIFPCRTFSCRLTSDCCRFQSCQC